MSLPFEKKVGLVTGTGSGMDLATARGFAEAGAAEIGKPAIAVFDSKSYDRGYLGRASAADNLDLRFHEFRYLSQRACYRASGFSNARSPQRDCPNYRRECAARFVSKQDLLEGTVL
jgi:hypothetical protein